MIKVLGYNILMEIIEEGVEEETTASGLVIPQSSRRQKQFVKGKVIGVGRDVEEITVGMIIHVPKQLMQEAFFNNTECALTTQEHVFAVEE